MTLWKLSSACLHQLNRASNSKTPGHTKKRFTLSRRHDCLSSWKKKFNARQCFLKWHPWSSTTIPKILNLSVAGLQVGPIPSTQAYGGMSLLFSSSWVGGIHEKMAEIDSCNGIAKWHSTIWIRPAVALISKSHVSWLNKITKVWCKAFVAFRFTVFKRERASLRTFWPSKKHYFGKEKSSLWFWTKFHYQRLLFINPIDIKLYLLK